MCVIAWTLVPSSLHVPDCTYKTTNCNFIVGSYHFKELQARHTSDMTSRWDSLSYIHPSLQSAANRKHLTTNTLILFWFAFPRLFTKFGKLWHFLFWPIHFLCLASHRIWFMFASNTIKSLYTSESSLAEFRAHRDADHAPFSSDLESLAAIMLHTARTGTRVIALHILYVPAMQQQIVFFFLWFGRCRSEARSCNWYKQIKTN